MFCRALVWRSLMTTTSWPLSLLFLHRSMQPPGYFGAAWLTVSHSEWAKHVCIGITVADAFGVITDCYDIYDFNDDCSTAFIWSSYTWWKSDVLLLGLLAFLLCWWEFCLVSSCHCQVGWTVNFFNPRDPSFDLILFQIWETLFFSQLWPCFHITGLS